MKKIFSRTHFDRDKQPKTLTISYNDPTSDQYGVKDGNIILSIYSKENNTGFLLSTGDIGDMIEVLTIIRKNLISKGLKIWNESDR